MEVDTPNPQYLQLTEIPVSFRQETYFPGVIWLQCTQVTLKQLYCTVCVMLMKSKATFSFQSLNCAVYQTSIKTNWQLPSTSLKLVDIIQDLIFIDQH